MRRIIISLFSLVLVSGWWLGFSDRVRAAEPDTTKTCDWCLCKDDRKPVGRQYSCEDDASWSHPFCGGDCSCPSGSSQVNKFSNEYSRTASDECLAAIADAEKGGDPSDPPVPMRCMYKLTKDGKSTFICQDVSVREGEGCPPDAIADPGDGISVTSVGEPYVHPNYTGTDQCYLDAREKQKEANGGGDPKDPSSIDLTNPGSAGEWLRGMNPLGGLDADGNPTGICAGDFTIGCIMSYIINSIVFPLSGLFLFLMIVWGGYQMVNGSVMGSQNTIQRGQQRIRGAFLGFLMLAAVFWLWKLIETLTGIQIT